MMFGFRFNRKSICTVLCLVAFSSISVFAQDYSAMGLPAVVASAKVKLQRGAYSEAIPALEEAISRTEPLTAPKMVEILQECRFQLARSFYQLGDVASGMKVLDDYLAQEPRKQERMALRMVTQGLFETHAWDRIETVASQLLDMTDLTSEDLLNANLMLGQALFQQKKWEPCIKPLTYTASNSNDPNIVQVTQVMIVRALAESEKWRELFVWIPRVYSTDAKYDITLNLAMLNAGKANYKQDEFLNALALYRKVLPRNELIDFSNTRIAGMSKKLANDTKIGITDMERKRRKKEIENLEELVTTLEELPPYEDEVAFRIGQTYYRVKRYWEGYVLFDKLYNQDRKSEIGGTALLMSLEILDDLGEADHAEKRIDQYLKEQPSGQHARLLLSKKMFARLNKREFDDVIALRANMQELMPSADSDELLIEADLHYMLALGYFQKKEFKLSGEQFSKVIDDYSDSPVVSNAIYYRGMTYMMQGDYESASVDFSRYQEKYNDGEYYADASFRLGICLFGLDKIPEAEKVFTQFIKAYPEDILLSEAYSMRGDIEAAKDGQDDPKTEANEYDPLTLDRALADYRKAIDKAKEPRQAAYAVFQAAKVYKLEFKWQEIADLMSYYMDIWKDQADVANAVFWIGQSQIAMGQVDDAIKAYIDAILSHGNTVNQDGIDKIIREMVTIAEQRLNDEDRDFLSVTLRLKETEVDPSAAVLKLRLKVTLALLEGKKGMLALGAKLLDTNQDLRVASPISLSVMCDTAVMKGDIKKMDQLYAFFIENFEESDDLWHAYRARTVQRLLEGDLEGVLATVKEAQEFFGSDSFMGWAQIIKADTLIKMKEYAQAEEAYNMVMGVPEWRGPLYAKAMYGMGQSRLAAGDIEAAHNFFQRTYLLFKAYDNGKWAAKSYIDAGNCLLRLGRESDAVKTWQDMLENEYVNTLPEVEVAREMIKKHGGAINE